MFDFFKKKDEKPAQPVQNTENKQYKEFAAGFLPEELTILAVTGANGFGGGQLRGEELWTASVDLTAWIEEYGEQVHRGSFTLTTPADGKLLEFLRRHTPPDFIIKCRARVSEDGRRLLLLDLPEPGFDPDLQAVLEEQKKPVTFEAEGLGTFTLNRQVNWFETEIDWLGSAVSLSFDVDESRADCACAARTLLAAAEDWDRRVREYAADELVSSANDWAEGEEEITREAFMERMEPESIEVTGDGGFQFWFADGDMFYGHSIRVSGDLEHGPGDAAMEG